MMSGSQIASEIIAGAQYLGSTLLLTQGAGGNNSVKDFLSDTLWIKASGINLSQCSGLEAFVGLSLRDVQNTVRDSALHSVPQHRAHEQSIERFVAAVRSTSGLRPSLETGMHAALPQRVVLHTHSVYVNAFSCMMDGKENAASVLPSHAWVPYATPGFDLAVATKRSVEDLPKPTEPLAIVLQNHGFVAAASSSNEAIALSEAFVDGARHFFGAIDPASLDPESPAQEMLDLVECLRLQLSGRTHGVPLLRAGRFSIFRSGNDLLKGSALHPFVPDDVVYMGPRIWCASSTEEAARLANSLVDRARFAIVVPRRGILFAGESDALLDAMEESMLAHMLIALLISRKGDPVPLHGASIAALAAMESEKYRRDLAARLTWDGELCKS